MKKNKLTIVAIIFLFATVPALVASETQPVAGATKGYVQVKRKKKVRLYNKAGKHSNFYAAPKRRYPYNAKKKIGSKKWVAYRIGSNTRWILAKDVKLVKKTPQQAFVQAKMKLPRGYTRAGLVQAYQGKPSKSFVSASMQGMKDNNFSRIKAAENKGDNQTIVNLDKLTPQQLDTLTSFAINLINEARSDLGLRPWVESVGTRKLAEDIASEYSKNGKTIKDGHYVPGIVRACTANGLNLNDNFVEDMAGFYNQKQTMSMTELKKSIYFGLKQMMFGYIGSGEAERNKRSYYQEWEHAGDLFNTQGSLHDGDYNYFGFSLSHTDNICSMHFISVPTYVVKNKKYNINFQP